MSPWDGCTGPRFEWSSRSAGGNRRRAPTTPVAEGVPANLLGVIDALRQLSPGQGTAVVLRYEADLEVKDIATAMGTSAPVVRVHLFRARRRLRELLGSEAMDDD